MHLPNSEVDGWGGRPLPQSQILLRPLSDRSYLLGFITSCGKNKDLRSGISIHADIIHRGYLCKDIFLNTALVSMYARCGLIWKAQVVFDELSDRDVASWNALIAGYSRLGLGEKALDCFKEMKKAGFPPNAVTFASVLKACGSVGSVGLGEEIHGEINKDGLLKCNNVLGNAIVDMYAKCGFINRAVEVFDELPVRDTVSWNILISGYVQNQLDNEALSCFRKMQNEGFSPDVVTFTCILKACGSTGSIEMGEEIHSEIKKSRLLEKSIAIGNALVDMYAKGGALGKAQEVFDNLSKRNVITWNVLIAGYTHHGLNDEALSCFQIMQGDGFLPDADTFSCVLTAYSNIKSSKGADLIYAEISKQGLLKTNVALGNTLLDVYIKCGLLSKARGIFHDLPKRNATSWNVMITGYVQHGLNNDALDWFTKMKDEGFFPNAVTFSCIIRACGKLGLLRKGEEIHSRIKLKTEVSDDALLLQTALVDMYAKCGKVVKAQEIFDDIIIRDAVSWTALISGYCQHGFGDIAMMCFQRMQEEGISPDEVTFSCIFKACSMKTLLDKGEQMHAKIIKQRWLEKDTAIGTAIINMYAKCGSLRTAKQVFDELSVRDSSSWNALITGYVLNDLNEEALKLFEKMEDEGFFPDAITALCILKACGNIGYAEKGEELHAKLWDTGLLKNDLMISTALVDMYIKCGALSRAREVFNQLTERDVVSWNALITGYIRHGLSDEALKCFIQMQDDSVRPDAVTFACILKACGCIGSSQMGEAIHSEIRKKLPIGKDVLQNSLVDMYAKCGAVEKAQHIFDSILFPDVRSWNALIAGYAQLGDVRKAFVLFNKMIMEDIMPNQVTFVIVIIACSHAGLVEEGKKCFHTMNTVYCHAPTLEHYSCIVDLFCRSERFQEAILMLEDIPSAERSELWVTVLSACQKSVHVELGRKIFEHSINSNEDIASSYICMSNIFAATNEKEVDRHSPSFKNQKLSYRSSHCKTDL